MATAAQGINFTMGANGTEASNFTNNTINGNTGGGINIALGTGGHFEGAAFYGNTIGTSTVPNGGLGVRLTVPDQASFNWNLGDTTQAANLITGNTGAGVGIDMSGSGTGNLHVVNSTFSNTAVGTDPNFNGEGLAVRMTNTSTLDNAVIGSFNAVNSVATNDVTFSNNAGAGLSFFATSNAAINNLLVTNVNSENNTGDGISFFRQGQPTFTNITVQNSQIQGNANGIHIIATNALLVDTYTINNNQILLNKNDGVLLDARFDSQIVANLTGNTINSNVNNGIELIEQQNASTDNRLISGTWTLNTISNNGGDGIDISARSNINIGASTTQIDNIISGNKGIGININGVNALSTTVIQGNEINNNGAEGINVNATANNVTINSDIIQSNFEGVELLAFNGASLNASIDNSSIRFNTDDGIQIQTAGQENTGGVATITIGTNNPNGNNISDNGGFGINILNNNNGQVSYNIANNSVLRNGLTGIYVVNTASADQGQELTYTLLADGSVFDHSQMQLVVNNNSILDNGHGHRRDVR